MFKTLQRKAKAIIQKQPICPWCLGRLLSNDPTHFEEIGNSIYNSIGMKIPPDCVLCKRIPQKPNIIQELLYDLSLYNFKTFSLGIIADQLTLRIDEDLLLKGGTSLKKGLSLFLIKKIEKDLAKTYRSYNSEIIIMLNLKGNPHFNIYMKPIIISINYAKYDKLVNIRAAPCNKCHGLGCKSCNFIGKIHDMSFESYLLYDLPLQLNSSMPRITWTTKEYENSGIYGKGKILYLEINKIFDPIKAPLLIPSEPIKGIHVLCSKKVNKKDVERSFIQILEITILIKHIDELITKKIEKGFQNKDLMIKGIAGKQWIKRIYWVKFLKVGKRKIIFRIKCDSGINIYNWLGANESMTSKHTFPKLFEDSKIKILKIDLLDQDTSPSR